MCCERLAGRFRNRPWNATARHDAKAGEVGRRAWRQTWCWMRQQHWPRSGIAKTTAEVSVAAAFDLRHDARQRWRMLACLLEKGQAGNRQNSSDPFSLTCFLHATRRPERPDEVDNQASGRRSAAWDAAELRRAVCITGSFLGGGCGVLLIPAAEPYHDDVVIVKSSCRDDRMVLIRKAPARVETQLPQHCYCDAHSRDFSSGDYQTAIDNLDNGKIDHDRQAYRMQYAGPEHSWPRALEAQALSVGVRANSNQSLFIPAHRSAAVAVDMSLLSPAPRDDRRRLVVRLYCREAVGRIRRTCQQTTRKDFGGQSSLTASLSAAGLIAEGGSLSSTTIACRRRSR